MESLWPSVVGEGFSHRSGTGVGSGWMAEEREFWREEKVVSGKYKCARATQTGHGAGRHRQQDGLRVRMCVGAGRG